MKKEKKCISLKLAKELQKIAKEKGFKLPESEYYWEMIQANDSYGIKYELRKGKIDGAYELIPAYDTAELGEMLPDTIFEQNIEYSLTAKKYDDMFSIGYVSTINDEEIEGFLEETEAEARCKMLIYLIKNGLKNTIK